MNEEQKGAIVLSCIAIPIFALAGFGWLHSPLYAEVKKDQRQNALEWLRLGDYHSSSDLLREGEKEKIMEKWGITQEEIEDQWSGHWDRYGIGVSNED